MDDTDQEGEAIIRKIADAQRRYWDAWTECERAQRAYHAAETREMFGRDAIDGMYGSLSVAGDALRAWLAVNDELKALVAEQRDYLERKYRR